MKMHIDEDHPQYGPPAPVPIIQEEAEFTPLLELYRERAPKSILEVGTYAGGTLFHWMQNAVEGARIVSVDWYDYDNSEMYPDWCPDGVSYEIVRGNTWNPEVVEQVRAFAPFDFAFLDAGHLDEEIRRDWANYGPMMGSDSVVAFHDIIEHEGLPRIQVFHLWRELRSEFSHIEIVATNVSSGIGVLFLP